MVASLGLALNESSYAALIVLRALQSLRASAVLSVSYGTVADICCSCAARLDAGSHSGSWQRRYLYWAACWWVDRVQVEQLSLGLLGPGHFWCRDAGSASTIYARDGEKCGREWECQCSPEMESVAMEDADVSITVATSFGDKRHTSTYGE